MSHETVPVREEIARPASDPPGAIFARFLKFGALAWGGPAAQIAMIKRECVDELHWVDEETFKKTLAVYQVLPGPEAVCGRQFAAGVAGIGVPVSSISAIHESFGTWRRRRGKTRTTIEAERADEVRFALAYGGFTATDATIPVLAHCFIARASPYVKPPSRRCAARADRPCAALRSRPGR